MTDPDPPHVDVPPEDEMKLMDTVDASPGVHAPTEEDEERVLRGLYGPADQYGVFRGERA